MKKSNHKHDNITHTATNTSVNMNADARAWTCFFSCIRRTNQDVVEPVTPHSQKSPSLENKS